MKLKFSWFWKNFYTFASLRKSRMQSALKDNRGVAQLVARYVRDVEAVRSSRITPTKWVTAQK